MDDSLYDEFGNYIGPDLESDQVRAVLCVVFLLQQGDGCVAA
jgi:hypothetical protein